MSKMLWKYYKTRVSSWVWENSRFSNNGRDLIFCIILPGRLKRSTSPVDTLPEPQDPNSVETLVHFGFDTVFHKLVQNFGRESFQLYQVLDDGQPQIFDRCTVEERITLRTFKIEWCRPNIAFYKFDRHLLCGPLRLQ